mmetsp:Transcript_51951/g.121641  ORF Transcript_51951/g.121641 Transcript_51951/m.121641 type:complete len:123 (+) Transcript_51951:351-719(+)
MWKVTDNFMLLAKPYLDQQARRSPRRAVIHGPVDHLPHLTAGECGGASECSICLKEYVEDTRVVMLPCKHTFHPLCAASWLARGNRACPLCRCYGGYDPRQLPSADRNDAVDFAAATLVSEI